MIGIVASLQPLHFSRSRVGRPLGAIHSSGQRGNAGFYRRPAFAKHVRLSLLPWARPPIGRPICLNHEPITDSPA
jgi:hypothetical protein